MKPKKSLGQNFLVDNSIISEFLKVAGISKEDSVLEVGAGSGNITKELARKTKKVIAVEYDKDLLPTLTSNLSHLNNVEVLNENVLFLPKFPSDKRLKDVN
ncbi:16S rRNA (adenine(1518)-N(6)/adenine(1519)-N(6))-dimethyltransferase, partial [candidate division WWE3 bacterium CG08_land_8_20_14_0_20_41_15]